MNREIFRMERVTYQENGVTFLKDFNLRIDEGEILGLIPVNGYGLNAFLKLLICFFIPRNITTLSSHIVINYVA